MNVYLMRHAEAVSASDWLGTDQDRPLSPIGIAKLDAALNDIKRLKLPVLRVVSSPFVRAKSTADLLAEGLGWKKPVVDARLASGAYAEAIRQTILDQEDTQPLLIVGHMPELAVFASRVTLDAKLLDTGLLPADIVAINLWWEK